MPRNIICNQVVLKLKPTIKTFILSYINHQETIGDLVQMFNAVFPFFGSSFQIERNCVYL